jgi:DNA modification methylase
MEINKIYLGDCIELMKQIPDESVDIILTDPPYNISKENDNRDRSKLNSPIMRRESPLTYDFGEWDNKSRDEFLHFTKEWLKECCRILKDGGTIISFFNKEDISYLGWTAKEYGIRTRTIFTWCKTNPTPSFRKVNYLSATEYLWVGSKGTKAWTFNFKHQKEMSNYYMTANSSSYGVTNHPTEKPIELLVYLLEIHSNNGYLVLDPFCGSGTTAEACLRLDRKFICIDNDQKYVDMATKRIEGWVQQEKIESWFDGN